MTDTGIGASVRRTEDRRFLTGKGNYTDDINRPGQSHAVFVRSPHAHAKIGGVDTTRAAAVPGVLAVLTGDDVAADGIGGMPCGFAPDGGPQNAPPRPALAQGKVRFVGDLVAMVIGETIAAAKDGADKVSVDYETLPASMDPAKTMDAGAQLLHEEAPNNLCVDWSLGDKDATDTAFAGAHHVAKLDLINNRKIPNAIEPRASLGDYDGGTDSYTLYNDEPEPAHHAAAAGGVRPAGARAQGARRLAGHRRRLRLEDPALSGRGAGDLGGQEGRPARQVDGGAL